MAWAAGRTWGNDVPSSRQCLEHHNGLCVEQRGVSVVADGGTWCRSESGCIVVHIKRMVFTSVSKNTDFRIKLCQYQMV